MKKPLAVISCPIDTYSGYGARSRDFVQALINEKDSEWDIKVMPQKWGNTRLGYLQDHKDSRFDSYIQTQLTSKPKVWIQITVPNEFQPVGEYNIGVTAAMETTLCDASWVEGTNRMDLVLTSSEHSKKSLVESVYDFENKRTGQKGQIKVDKQIEVLFEGVSLEVYNKENKGSVDIIESLDSIKESFCFLFVGHWLQGEHRQDRKNVSGMIETFLHTFKTQHTKPALILKTQSATSSLMDKNSILKKIDKIRKDVGGTLPNIYLLHGELTDADINTLYCHPKVKAMVNLTRGEGFGRPLLEFSTTGKPIIASAWSGHVDYLRKDLVILVGGKLEQVHKSAVVKNMILENAKWFTYNEKQAREAFKFVYKQYKKASTQSRKQKTVTEKHFSFEKMQSKLKSYIDKYVPFFPMENSFKAPLPQKIELPKRTRK